MTHDDEVEDDPGRRAQILDTTLFYARQLETHARNIENVAGPRSALTHPERRAARACARTARAFRKTMRKRERDIERDAERRTRQRAHEEATSRLGDLSVVGDAFATHVVPMLASDGRALVNLCLTSKACKTVVEMSGVLPHEDVRAFCSKHADDCGGSSLFSRASVFERAVREKDFMEGNPDFQTLKFACARWGLGPLPQIVFEKYLNNAYRIHERLREVEWLLRNTTLDESPTRACELVVRRLAYFMIPRSIGGAKIGKKTVARVVAFLKTRIAPLVAAPETDETDEERVEFLTPAFRVFLESNPRLVPILRWAEELEAKKK